MIYAVMCQDRSVYWDTSRTLIATIYRAESKAEYFELDMLSDGDQVTLDRAVTTAVRHRLVRPVFSKDATQATAVPQEA